MPTIRVFDRQLAKAATGQLAAQRSGVALAPYVRKSGALAAAWPNLAIEQQRAIVAAVVGYPGTSTRPS